MVSTIRIGPEGGPYVKVEENNGTLDIITPNDTVDLQSNDLVNAALGGIMDANGNDITNVNQLDANSVNTDQAILNNTTVNVQSFTIADDDVVSFGAGSTREFKVITDGVRFNGAWGGDFGDLYEIWTAQATTTSSGPLSGTTGADGDMTVSRDGNTVYIENRRGGQLFADAITFDG